jgi:flagella basal body P-ring formation protein FlgA
MFYKALVFALIFGSIASAATTINVRDRVELDRPVVRLGDVAEIIGADRQQVRRLAALPLMPAPTKGAQRFLRKQEIQDLLAAHGETLRNLRIDGAEQVTIVGSDSSGQSEPARMNRHAAVLAGHGSLAAIENARPTHEPSPAKETTPLVPVVVAAAPIARGDIITAANLEVQMIERPARPSSRRAAVDAVEKVVGMEARQAIQAGEIVFGDQVRAPLLVKRGDLITVSTQGSGIRVRTTAKARQDASYGELVQVESLETRERYDARVIGHREATIATLSTHVNLTQRR